MTDTKKQVQRAYYAATFPFKPDRIRTQSDHAGGFLCNCPSCAAAWILGLAMDMNADEENKTDVTLFSILHSLSVFFEVFVRDDPTDPRPREDVLIEMVRYSHQRAVEHLRTTDANAEAEKAKAENAEAEDARFAFPTLGKWKLH